MKVLLNTILAAAFAVSLSNSSGIVQADNLCTLNDSGGCTDTGCSNTFGGTGNNPGICGHTGSESTCICFYP